ncbi:MAG: hypothetical protein RLZZ543_888, partial [Bacteroidota bacterium]
MQLNRYLYLLLLAITAFATPTFAQCPNQAPIDLLQQNNNVVTVGTTLQAPSGSTFYSWNFGDGSFGTGQYTGHSYSTQGVYVITLTMVDSAQTSWCATGVYTVQIGSNCNLSPTINYTPQGAGTYAFNVAIQGGTAPYTYYWNFNNGSVSTLAQPLTTFPNGIAYACCYVTDASGCSDSVCVDVIVNDGACQTNFLVAQPQMNLQNLSLVVYNNNNIAPPIALHIDYGDGTSQDATMTGAFTAYHPYTDSIPTHNLCITGVDANGCVDTLCQLVQSVPCPNISASFQSYPLTGTGLQQFYANASGGSWPYYYNWEFGNGTSLNSDTASYAVGTYPAPGNFTACLTVTDANGCSAQNCQQVIITPCGNFAGNIASTSNGLTAIFTPQIVGGCGNFTYAWSCMGQTGNGTTFQATATSVGTYPVTLTVGDACGCSITITGSVTFGCNPSGGSQVVMHTGTQTVCNAIFTDAGGANGQYQNNENYTLTLYPATTGAKLRVAFNMLQVETNYDYLYIYNGASTSAPLLATLNGATTPTQAFTSTASDGSLTFRYTSDGTVIQNGWNAQLSCVDLAINSVNQNDGTWQISAQSGQSWASLSWTVDGTVASTSSSFNVPLAEGYHTVCLTAVNSLGCSEQVCTNVNVPCTYNVQFTTEINANTVTVNVLNPNPLSTLTLYSDQIWVPFDLDSTASYAFITGGIHQVCVMSDGVCPDTSCDTVDIGAGNTAAISGYVWDDMNGNGLMENNESPFSNVYVQLCQMSNVPQPDTASCIYAYTDVNGFYSFDVFPGNYSLQSYFWQSLYLPTTPVEGNGYNFSISDTNAISGFNFGYQNQGVSISGTVFYDTNNNGIQETGEQGAPYKSIHVGGYWINTNYNGYYTALVPAGTYVVSLNNPGVGYVVSVPASPYTYTINASAIGSSYTGNNFGLWADPNMQDLSASIHHISTVTPGFPVMTHLSYCNNGITAQSGTFTYYWDPQLAISSPSVFNPAPTTFSAATNTASWNFSNLQPGTCSYIYQNTPAPTSLVLGTPVFNTVVVTPLNDYNPSNNIDTLHQTVVGSWDPNDKQGVPPGIGEEGSILPNTRLSYTIRFQNTGSAPAVNVVLVDTLSSDFVLETFSMNAASDAYSVHVDQATRVIRWTFNNIMLPDSTSDPIGSIGFVNFSIDPVQNQLDGTVLNNFADIYFDFNSPIRTNTTVHTINRNVGMEAVKGQTLVNVYPNPFSGSTQFLVNTPDNSNANVQIYNMLGEVVASFSVESGKLTSFDASGYAAGMYTYKVTSKKGNSTGKLVIR